jgi:DNA-binding GntR family transcriptional regulator
VGTPSVDTMSAKPVRRGPNLSAQVYDAICELIVSGALRSGDRVVLDRLAQDMGVSHTPVREALARMLQEGLVVDGDPPGRLHLVPLTPEYVHSTYLVRGVLEGLAAELAIPNLAPEDLDELRALILEIGGEIDNPDPHLRVRNDRSLHRLLWEASRNPVLLRELEAIDTHINYIRGYSLRHFGDHVSRGHKEHLEILDALVAGDAQRARTAMEQHVRNTSGRIVGLMEQEELGAPLADDATSRSRPRSSEASAPPR